MNWKELKKGDFVTYTINDYDGKTAFVGRVSIVESDHIIIESDLAKTPENKRKYDVNNWIDEDFENIMIINSVIRVA